MKHIISTPSPYLTKSAQPVAKINSRVKQVITDMKQAIKEPQHPKGVGLAAPQIGVDWRIFIIWPDRKQTMQVFINPQFVNKSRLLTSGVPNRKNPLEGCLSIPKVWGLVKRHTWVILAYLTETGEKKTVKFTGFTATIIQHEMDHLDGILFPRRVLEQKGKLYKPGKDDEGKPVLELLEI